LSPKRIAIIRHEVGVDCFRTSRGLEQMQSVGLYWGGPGTSPTQVCRLGSGPRRQAVSLRGPRCPLLTFRMNFGTACRAPRDIAPIKLRGSYRGPRGSAFASHPWKLAPIISRARPVALAGRVLRGPCYARLGLEKTQCRSIAT
jgi:hypothetical protein